MDSGCWQVEVVDVGTRFVVVVIAAPDRWIFYPLSTDGNPKYAQSRAYSFPRNGALCKDVQAVQRFVYDFTKLNGRDAQEDYTTMAILAALRDGGGSVPAATLDIKEKRELIYAGLNKQ